MTAIEPADVAKGQMVTFTAVASDPDSDSFTVTWAFEANTTCPDSHSPTPSDSTYTIPAQPFCVWAFATDRYGAVGAANHTFNPGNHPPVAVIDLLDPEEATSYPLFTKFKLSGHNSSDPDGDPLITFDWRFVPPQSSTATLDPCPTVDIADMHCFQADQPGRYQVELKVSDTSDPQLATDPNHQGTAPPLSLLVNADQPPCIGLTDPPYASEVLANPLEDKIFKVKEVLDDGDPSPPVHDGQFSWFYTPHGSSDLAAFSNNYNELRVTKDTFKIGDVAEVRVQVYDRNRDAIDKILDGCGNEPLCAAMPGSGCYQRVTWKVKWILTE